MSSTSTGMSRREFFRGSLGGGFALGSVFGFGLDLRAAQRATVGSRFIDVREVPSVCPYCAVGCGQLVTVNTQTEKIVNIEGNPNSPINRGTLCPKGAATFQLAVNPLRVTKVWYRAPRTTEWDKTRTLDWAMDRIAQLTRQTRDDNFHEFWKTHDAEGKEVQKRVNHTLAIGSLGGATMDNEWNYVQAKLMRALGVVNIENQARI
jgi:formate dehydrogenase major subunit